MRPLLFGSGKGSVLYDLPAAVKASMRPLLFGSGKRFHDELIAPIEMASMRPLLFGSGKHKLRCHYCRKKRLQ